MTTVGYWFSFLVVCVYFAVMVRCWQITRKQAYRQRLSTRLAPYHGANLARAHPEPDTGTPDLVSDWRRLREMAPPHAQPLVSKLERKHLLAEALLHLHENLHPFTDDGENVVQLHPGPSVKVG